MNDQELSDTELFDQAVTGDGAEDISSQQTDQQVEPTQQQADTQATSQDQQTDADRQQIDDNAPHIPSWRLREVNEERRRFAEENERIKAELAELRRASQQQRPQEQAKPEKAKPDPLIDPDGYEKYLEQKFEERQLAISRENSLRIAARTYKDEFQEAYKAAQEKVDPALRALMQSSDDPGETLVQWHRQQKTMQEVGNDPKAWFEKQLEERMKDPAFLAKAVDLARGAAQPGQNNGRPKVEMPRTAPSLSGASRANAALRSTVADGDVSDRELFEQIAG